MVHLDVRTLAPGVRLHVSRDPRWKTTCAAVRIACALDEDPTRTALVPAVLDRGTERFPTDRALTIRLEELYGADLSSDVVRLGDVQAIELRLEVADERHARAPGGPEAGGGSLLAEGVALLADVVFRPPLDARGFFRADEVRIEKENQRREIEGLRDDRAAYAMVRARRLLGRGEPSARYELGDVAELGAIGPADLTARWRALVERGPLDILVAGDIAPDDAETLVRRVFPLDRRRRDAPAALPPTAAAPRPDPPAREVERAGIGQAHLCLGWRTGVTYLDPDYAALFILNVILGADAQSRLFLNVREDAGLAYEAGTSLDRSKGALYAHFGIDPGNAARVEGMVLAEVERLRAEDVAGDELAEARAYAEERAREIEDDAGLRLAFSYARTLAGREDVRYEDLVARLGAVTAADVRRVAHRLRLDSVFLLTNG